ncbi:MAG: ThuA domain-containing protein [Pirellulales bacterium]|nr:ThuA domain-containing protein [Pirellulales bacterium]
MAIRVLSRVMLVTAAWVIVMCLGVGPCRTGRAAAAWVDARMPVSEGLELWLDGAHVGGAKELASGTKVEEWLDGSGKERNLRQSSEEKRPKLLRMGSIGALRFDGVDDHLRATNLGSKLDSFTIVAVAAPRQNLGGFQSLLAMNAVNERDYTSGLNIDLGPMPTTQFSTLNIEGRGFGGAKNLLTSESPFARLRVLAVLSEGAGKPVRLVADGEAQSERPREAGAISFEELTVGARYYNNGPGPQQAAGFGPCDIAEVLIYNRALGKEELDKLQQYLRAKYDYFKDVLPPDRTDLSAPLEPVKNPPPVQVLLPGFEAREMPVELTNINNVKYRADGVLVAQAYDGKIWLLRDTNGDGLEDQADLFWDNARGVQSAIGFDLTPPGYARGQGVVVATKTECVLVLDTNGDDRADEAIELASGWKEAAHPVGALGAAFDPRDGSIYFGLGSANYTDPLLHDASGNAQYRLDDERGTIMRIAPDLKTREIMVTGIRFPVAMRFNSRGDLFATDQEGATWVPNGNPLDELLHIQKGRHYGFPARHPRHLPNVIDEPSTYDYSPQHQSTCGLNFNEPVKAGGPSFGPKTWAGDAIVTGYSRGKLYRTKLVHTNAGYLADTQLVACLSMLTVDACVSPTGELVVSCHSGGPDWGNGPDGKGKLYKVTYRDRERPQPVLAWAAGPREVRVEFDRPVPPERLQSLLAKAKLVAGPNVRAGDRFETLWPGYAIVQGQKLSLRYDVPLRSAQLTPDGRTLVLATDPLMPAAHFALTLPDEGQTPSGKKDGRVLPQHAAIDLDFDLGGCEASWQPENRESARWSGWLPHFDLNASLAFTAGSEPHEALAGVLNEAGELTLRGKLDLTDMLRPSVQPGSKIDYEYPPETVTVTMTTTSPQGSLQLVGELAQRATTNGAASVSFTLPANAAKIVPFELHLKKSSGAASLQVEWTTNEDDRPRPLVLRRIFLPWADPTGKREEAVPLGPPPELVGGSWARGYREFYGEQASCSKCHTIYGRGGNIGPDLSNLVHRDYASVLRDITQPSFAINPDHLSYLVTLTDGRVLTGVVRGTGDELEIGDSKGVFTKIKRSDVEEMRAAAISIMPEKLPEQLGPERLRDLLTFLLTPAPAMPHDHAGPRPKARTVAEVDAVLAGSPEPAETARPLRIVLVAGPKDHGVGEHDYPAWQKAWSVLLSASANVTVDTAWEWPTNEQFEESDVVVIHQHGAWNERRAADTDAFLERGGGLVYIHWSLDGGNHGPEFARRIGLAKDRALAFRHGPLDLMFNRRQPHPITRNFERLKLVDEAYWKLSGELPSDRILATSDEDGEPQPQLWTTEPGKGRVFVCIPGHYSWTFDDPLFRVLLLRGIAWTAREPVDRFNELVWLGADRP